MEREDESSGEMEDGESEWEICASVLVVVLQYTIPSLFLCYLSPAYTYNSSLIYKY